MSIADLIQWGRTAQRTGLLKLRSEDAREIDIVFRDGRIVFSSTNERRNRWRGYLIYLALLVREGKITYDQALATLNEKTMEDVCDVFLWTPRSRFSSD